MPRRPRSSKRSAKRATSRKRTSKTGRKRSHRRFRGDRIHNVFGMEHGNEGSITVRVMPHYIENSYELRIEVLLFGSETKVWNLAETAIKLLLRQKKDIINDTDAGGKPIETIRLTSVYEKDKFKEDVKAVIVYAVKRVMNNIDIQEQYHEYSDGFVLHYNLERPEIRR